MTIASLLATEPRERSVKMGIETHEESFVPTPLTLEQHSYLIAEHALSRIEEQADTRIVYRVIFDTHFSSILRSPQEILARRGVSAVGDGLKYTLREYMLETALYDSVDNFLLHISGNFSSFLRDVLSGDELQKNTPSPREIQFLEERRGYTGLQIGIRPFRDDPYVFVSHGLRDNKQMLHMENSLRLTLERWKEPAVGFFTEIPLHHWSLGLGLEKKFGDTDTQEWERNGQLFTSTDQPISATVGLRGKFMHGFAYLGANLLAKQVFALWRFQY